MTDMSKPGDLAAGWGHFSGLPQTLWLTGPGPDRMMKLVGSFTFHDTRRGKTWTARDGLEFDGTSIPRSLWSLSGSPYTGDYRYAAIVHDQVCADYPREGPERRAGDRMFMRACLAGGCSRLQAQLFYLAVRLGSTRTLFDKTADVAGLQEIWLDGPSPEATYDQAVFTDIGREIRASDSLKAECDPDQAADEIDAMLVSRSYPAT